MVAQPTGRTLMTRSATPSSSMYSAISLVASECRQPGQKPLESGSRHLGLV